MAQIFSICHIMLDLEKTLLSPDHRSRQILRKFITKKCGESKNGIFIFKAMFILQNTSKILEFERYQKSFCA